MYDRTKVVAKPVKKRKFDVMVNIKEDENYLKSIKKAKRMKFSEDPKLDPKIAKQ